MACAIRYAERGPEGVLRRTHGSKPQRAGSAGAPSDLRGQGASTTGRSRRPAGRDGSRSRILAGYVVSTFEAVGGSQLLYHEATLLNPARTSVVLGNPAHAARVPVVVFANAPNSLREVESTTTFRTR